LQCALCATGSSISPSVSKLLDLLRESPQTNRRPLSSSIMQLARTTRTRPQPQHATAMRSQSELTGMQHVMRISRQRFRLSGDHGDVGNGKGRIKTAQLNGLRRSNTISRLYAACQQKLASSKASDMLGCRGSLSHPLVESGAQAWKLRPRLGTFAVVKRPSHNQHDRTPHIKVPCRQVQWSASTSSDALALVSPAWKLRRSVRSHPF